MTDMTDNCFECKIEKHFTDLVVAENDAGDLVKWCFKCANHKFDSADPRVHEPAARWPRTAHRQ